MRGLLKAGLLLAPALASAFVVPEKWIDEKVEEAVVHNERISSACVDVHVPVDPQSESADLESNDSIQFCLNVMPSKQNCGIANVAVNDQILSQDTSDNGHSIGKGSIISDNRGIVVANWDFECVPIGDDSTVQLLKFTVEYVDGKALENTGFTAAFTQADKPQINRLDAGITEEDAVTYASGTSLAFIPHDTIVVTVENFEDVNIEEEMAELELMKAEARHLRYLIHEKERFIHRLVKEEEFQEDIQECDSLKCVIKLTMSKVRNAAHGVLSKVAGPGPHYEGFEIYGEPAFGHKSHHGPPPPCRGKHHGPPPPPRFPHLDKPKNGSRHGNGTHHHHGNETHPHPHPHPHPPPPGFCHCPPPPPHHGDHPYPPHHDKPGNGKGPKGPKGGKGKKPHGPGKPPGDHEGHPPPPPPPAGKPEAPKGDHHGPPPNEGEHRPEDEHHGPPPPPKDGEHHPEGEHHGPPPPFDGKHEGEHHEHHGPPPFDGEHEGEHHEHHGPPPSDGEHEGEHHEHHGPPPFDGEHEVEHHEHHGPPPPFDGEHHGPPPPFDGEHHGPEGEHHGPPPPFGGEHHGPEGEHHGPPPPFGGEHHGPEGEHHGPPPPFGGEHHGPEGEHHGPPPPFDGEHEGEHHEHHGPPPFGGEHHGPDAFSQGFEGHHRPPHHGPPHMMVLKFSAIGFVLAFLVISLYRRCCTPRSRAARQARREERHRRRAYRRAEHRNSLRSFFENLVKSQTEKDHEEKMALMEADCMEEVMRFRSGVVDIVAAEEGRFTDDELPAYEDAESCDSLIADGMLYEPGSEYTPGSSDAGSLHEVLGVKAPVDTDKTSA